MTRRGQQVFERIVVDHVARIAAGLEDLTASTRPCSQGTSRRLSGSWALG